MKRKISTLLILTMVLSIFSSITAFAYSYSDILTYQQNIAADPTDDSNYSTLASARSQLGYSGVVAYLDGQEINTYLPGKDGYVGAKIQNGEVYLPIRAVGDALNAKASLGIGFTNYTNADGKTGTVTMTGGKAGTVVMTISSVTGTVTKYTVGGSTYTSPTLYYDNWRILVPTSFISSYMASSSDRWISGSAGVAKILQNPQTNITTPNAPTCSHTSNTYTGSQTIYLYSNQNYEIRYTTDGYTEPTKYSTLYSGPITVSNTTTIKAKCFSGNTGSSTLTVNLTINSNTITPSTPYSNISTNTYTSTQTVYIYSPQNYEIRYTLDGYEPTQYSTLYTGPITVSCTTTVKARCFYNGTGSGTLTIVITIQQQQTAPSQPTITSNGGTGTQYVTITSPDSGVEIRYTTDGYTEPTQYSTYYSGPFTISATTTVRAKAFRNGMGSPTAIATITVQQQQTAPSQPTITSNGGTGTQYVTITSPDSGVEIRYTTDGYTEPTQYSTYYSGPFTISATTTVRAKAFRNGMGSPTAVATITVNANLNMPTITPTGGSFTTTQYATIYSPDGAEIRYTTDGNEPTQYSTYYSSSIYVDRDMTIKAKAFRNGASSPTAAATFYINGMPSQPTCSPAAGVYTTTQYVYLYCADSNAQIRYTTDGSEPTQYSNYYSGPITVSNTTTVKAKAFRNNYGSSTMVSTYVLNVSVNQPYANPAPGVLSYAQYVTLTSSDSSEIRYTTDGYSEPTKYSTLYTSPIYVNGNMTIRAKAFKGDNYSTTLVAAYTINGGTISQPTASPAGGKYTAAQWVTLSCADSGATIRYTTDGTEPTESSSVYAYSIYISKNTTIKAKAYKNNATSSTMIENYVYSGAASLEDSDSRLAEARRLFNLGKYDASIDICDELLDDDPDMQDAIILKANNYVKKGNMTTAKSVLKVFMGKYEFPRVINRYGEVCIANGEASEGKNAILNIIQRYPNETYLYKTITYANDKLGLREIPVYIYGKDVNFDLYDNIHPIIVDGRTLMPIRAFSETAGAAVDWNSYQRKAIISLEGNTITLIDKDNIAIVNGKRVQMDVPAQIYGERMLIPLRFVSENFGKTVDWYEIDRARTISVTEYDVLTGNKSVTEVY